MNESFARRWFPGESPIGKRIDFGWDTEGLQTIVGVVGDLRERSLTEPPVPTVYVPYGQRIADPCAYVVVRTGDPPEAGGRDPMRLVGAVRAAVYAVDPDQPIDEVRTLDAVVASALAGRVLAGMLFGIGPTDPVTFAGVAALLACVALVAAATPAVRASRVAPVRALRES